MQVHRPQGKAELCWLNRGSVTITVLSREHLLSEAVWLGFITREECSLIKGRYVWIEATELSSDACPSSKQWVRQLKHGEFVQGWQTEAGVCAVSDNVVSVIEKF